MSAIEIKKAIDAVLPLVHDEPALTAALQVLAAALGPKKPAPATRPEPAQPRRGKVKAPNKRRGVEVPQEIIDCLERAMKGRSITAASADVGISRVLITRIMSLKRTSAATLAILTAWAKTAKITTTEIGTADVWELAEARASVLGIESRSAIIIDAGGSSDEAILAWATKPLDMLERA